MREIVKGANAAGITVIATLSGYADYLRAIRDLRGVLSDPEMRFASPAAYSEKIPTHRSMCSSPMGGYTVAPKFEHPFPPPHHRWI